MSSRISASEAQVGPLVAVAAPERLGFARATWEHWKKIARAVGVVQTRLLMVLFYFVAVFPVGLVMRMRGDPLRLKPSQTSNWTPHRHQEPSLESARRQF